MMNLEEMLGKVTDFIHAEANTTTVVGKEITFYKKLHKQLLQRYKKQTLHNSFFYKNNTQQKDQFHRLKLCRVILHQFKLIEVYVKK